MRAPSTQWPRVSVGFCKADYKRGAVETTANITASYFEHLGTGRIRQNGVALWAATTLGSDSILRTGHLRGLGNAWLLGCQDQVNFLQKLSCTSPRFGFKPQVPYDKQIGTYVTE